jgi:membrane peptidoglycan carboxypeptidase
MRILLKTFLALIASILLLIAAGAAWFYLYSGDLPQVKDAGSYAPNAYVQLPGLCGSHPSYALPYNALGWNLQQAIRATEGINQHGSSMAMQIARGTYCTGSHRISRQLQECRVAAQLRLRYTPEQLLTIYANTIYIGQEARGVEAAAQAYFSKHAYELDLAQTAAIAGMIQRPSYFSPQTHPARTKARRDQVLDKMTQYKMITASQAAAAKAEALLPGK